MAKYLTVFAASVIAAGSLMSVDARTTETAPRMITQTEDGKPIQLARMVVTAPPLPEGE